jgi:hypothetical protein
MTEVIKENDNIYLNITFSSPKPEYKGVNGSPPNDPNTYVLTKSNPVVMEYSVNKTQPILNRCSDYYMTVIKFDIPLTELPLFIMPIIPADEQLPNPVNPNLTPMVLGIKYNNIFNSEFLIFTPDSNLSPPTQIGKTQIITRYYFTYAQSVLINMMNTALLNAYNNSGLAALFPSVEPPFFMYDPITELISIVVHRLFTINTPPAVGIPEIYINAYLLHYLESFPVYLNGYGMPYGADFTLQLTNTIPLNPTLPPQTRVFPSLNTEYVLPGGTSTNPPTYYKIDETFSSVGRWNSLKKILITTSSIPIVNESVPAKENSGMSVNYPIITDFTIPLTYAGDSRSIAYYTPSGQYRLTDMISDLPLYKIDVKVQWMDFDDHIFPVYLAIGGNANIKLGFLNKKLYKQTSNLLRA